jgi:O-antigen/teichoic acid export membrane protein
MSRSLLLGVGGKTLEAVMLVLLITVVPRLLGPSDYGTFAVALSVVTLGSAASALGGPTPLSRFVPMVDPRERPGLARELALRSAKWRAGVCAVAAAGGLGLWLSDPGRFRLLPTALVVLALVLDVAATLVYQVGLALGGVALWSLRYPLQTGVLVAAVPALQHSFGSDGALAGIVVASAVVLAVGVVPVVSPLLGVRSSAGLPQGAVRFALVYGASGFFVQLLHRGGVLAVAVLAGSQVEAGFTALSIGIALGLTYAVWQVFTLELPRLAAGGAGATQDNSVRTLAWLALWVVVPITALAAAALDRLVPALAGERYRGVEASLGPALAIVPLAPLASAAAQAAALSLRPLVRLAASSAGALVFVVAALLLVPDHGSAGATTALLIGTAAMVAVGAAVFRDFFGLRLAVVSLGASCLVLGVAAWT